ncbi:MAG: DNA (cytosine-5-)-methyltransferase [Sphaerochaeta sp.]|nr:DNA (cytosine-5-)-methyltransferase [Sphaerochaeta sp.]
MNNNTNNTGPTSITLFAGGGGSIVGSKNADCKELLAIDFDENSCEVLKLNNTTDGTLDFPVWQRDIQIVTSTEIMEATGLQVGGLDILNMSPPCQGFSTQNTKRDLNHPLNRLIYHAIRFIREMQPKVFIIENVPGMVQGIMQENWKKKAKVLISLGYRVRWKILDASHYDVPQARERVFVIGIRNDLGITPTFPKPDLDHVVTFTEATGKDGFLTEQYGGKVFWGDRPCFTITKNRNMSFYGDKGTYKPGIDNIKEIDDVKALCGFPRDYKLIGSSTEQWARLGNAVMPPVMEAIVRHIRETVFDHLNMN